MTLRIYCPSCFGEVRNDSHICPSCGMPLDDIARRRLESHESEKSSPTKFPSFDSIDNPPTSARE